MRSAFAPLSKNETTRDVVQKKLFGQSCMRGRVKSVDGTGLVPGEDIGAVTWKRGVQDLIDTVRVKHVSGDWSTIGLKSYEQGRGAFEGVEKDIVWFDEEPPGDCYTEALVRTMTTQGHVLLTFTPLEGMSEVVLMFLPGGALPPRDEAKVGNVLGEGGLLDEGCARTVAGSVRPSRENHSSACERSAG